MPKKRSVKNGFIEPPELPEEASAGILLENQLQELDSYHNIWVSSCKLIGAKGVTINRGYFKNVQISDTKFPRFDLSNSRLDKCDFANTELERANFNQVEFIGCRILGFKVFKSHIKDTLIKDCHGKFAQFESTKFISVRFENCNLEDSDFQNTDLSHVVFLNCNMQNVILSGAKLVGTDFRSSSIENLQVSLEQLREAIFEPIQAVYLLQRYTGVVVKPYENEH